ncbi:MAG: nucleoside monophosphate kinase [Lentisphaeria bacterium]|nr:nucleoside monophosphate kinase [Lentisphaeria bacterium]
MSKAYIFLGAPGAGKGTLGEIFCEKTEVIHISTGQLLRDEMAAGTELGKSLKELIASGALVSDEIVTEMVDNRLAKDDAKAKGVMLDGYPRTSAQAESLTGILAKHGYESGVAVLVDVPRDILMKRLTGRRLCKACGASFNVFTAPPAKEGICDKCGAALIQRSDDTEATAINRLKIYDEQTVPVIDYYRNRGELVVSNNGDAPIEQNYAVLMKALGI